MAYWTYFKLDWSKAGMWVHCGELSYTLYNKKQSASTVAAALQK